ncbi:MAG: fused MFS/spermidine synthase [Myxococcota bacterium]|nr:fused MFS/spermidine synthase [Myxococcota bacterium]
MVRVVALALTVVTGFSGLVYEVAWQKYLAVLLGSHSEATAAVLAIFLGALALGYALFGRIARRLVDSALERGRSARLLVTYGCVEMAIGVYAFAFPMAFDAVQALSLMLPVANSLLAFGIDVGLCALLIGPPAVLMGATVPLLTQGLSRDIEDATRLHALVYATNTAGAFAGALSAAFVLVPWLGLQGTVAAMGGVNLAAGLALLALGRTEGLPARRDETAGPPRRPEGLLVFTAVALLSGFAVMTLQVVMNRVGAVSLGASHFTFAMVVATFVLSIALGSFAVAGLRRIPAAILPISQWLLVVCLLVLYPFVEDAPYWAHRVRASFPSEASSFYPFHLAVFAGILGVFVLPLGISGATLPLLFHHLRREVGDLGHVAGKLYSWNTAGSLLGALVGGYALLHWLDLNHSYRIAVCALLVGALLLSVRVLARAAWIAVPAAIVCGAILFALPEWSPEKLSAGLFRKRTAVSDLTAGPRSFFESYRSGWGDDYVAFYDDDPAISVAVHRREAGGQTISVNLLNNGKSDSTVPGDDVTTGLLGLVPALLAKDPRRAFVIGYGTGMTVGRLLALDSMDEVVVAEISPAVPEAAAHFEELNGGVMADPKTRILNSDAYRALLRSEGTYDVIVSEPSNPWVTGVEMLYSQEFFRAVRSRLSVGGVFVQWFHTYEMDEDTTALVLETFRSVFPRNAIWFGRGADLMLVGFEDDDARVDLDAVEERWNRQDYRSQFAELKLHRLPQLLVHELTPLGVLAGAELPPRIHTLGRPVLSHQSALAFYRGEIAPLPDLTSPEGIEVGKRTSLIGQYRSKYALSDEDRARMIVEICRYRREPCVVAVAAWETEGSDSELLPRILKTMRQRPEFEPFMAPEVWETLVLLFDPEGAEIPVEQAAVAQQVFYRYYSFGDPFPEAAMSRVRAACEAGGQCAP